MDSDLRKQKFFKGFSFEKAALLALILFGVGLRLRQYFAFRSLWLDEAMLALNIVGRSFVGLLQPLDDNQGAPVGFLLAEKLVVTLLGNNELTLRLIPLLAGCASLLLYALVLRQGLGKIGAFTALTLFAAGAPLVYYASEVKQYSSDVFIALLLLWLAAENLRTDKTKNLNHEALRALTTKDTTPLKNAGQASTKENIKSFSACPRSLGVVVLCELRGKKVFLALAGVLSVWFSHPALFVLAGVGATLLLHHAVQKEYQRLKETLVMIAIWAASFGALYFVNLRGLAANPFLFDYWSEYFMPLPPWADLAWFPTTLKNVLQNPVGLDVFWLIPASLMLVGLITLMQRNRWFGAFLILTLTATLTVSGLGKYPFAGRMILFTAPIFLALVGAGVDALAGWFHRPRWLGIFIAVIMGAFLIYQPLLTAAQNFVSPKYAEHIHPSMVYLQANHKPGDALYVYYWTVPAFRYYAPFYGFSENDFIAGNNYEKNPSGLLAEIDRYKGQKRFWILFSHIYEKGDYNEKDALLAHLNQIGTQKREFHRPGASVYLYLYDLTKGGE